MNFDLHKAAAFGVAGNFTGHLEQAGEASDFLNIKTAEQNAPKALFPTFIPSDKTQRTVPPYLLTFPFDSQKIMYPHGEQKIQLEPECAVFFEAEWNNSKIESLKPLAFSASNDCSIRKAGAEKISMKKNWGTSSKGISDTYIALDDFSPEGILNKYRIASFMIRNGTVFEYGENSAVRNYSYIYEKLTDWIIEKLNFQKNEGPAENIHSYLLAADKPAHIAVSIGATRYTEFGKTHFLENGDESVVVLYPEDCYTPQQIQSAIQNGGGFNSGVSVLRQKIVL